MAVRAIGERSSCAMLAELKEGAKRNPIWFGAVATITGVQAFFAYEFWGAMSHDPVHQAALRALGLGFVAGEVVALDMASRADLDEEKKRANTLRALWMVLAVTTFSADINALSSVLRDGDDERTKAVAAFDAQQGRVRDLGARIEAADDPYDETLLSVAAYDASIRGKEREIAAARNDGAPGSQRRRLESELTALQGARATAKEVDEWERERTRLLALPALHEPRPATGPVEFQPFADMVTQTTNSVRHALGARPDALVGPEDIRTGMAWVATFAMKLMLTFGVWGGLQRTNSAHPKRRDVNEPTEATPERPNIPPKAADGARAPQAGARSSVVPARKRPSAVVFGRGGTRFPR